VNISLEFQEFIVIVVAPLVYQGAVILNVFCLFVAVSLPLLEIARTLRRYGKRGI
jgi:hypothetical protein